MIARNATWTREEAEPRGDTGGAPEPGGLTRGLRAIEFLLDATSPVSATRLAQALNCEPSSALRILRTLVVQNYAIRDEATKLYLPGPKSLLPLGLYHPVNEIRRDMNVVLNTLREETDLTTAALLFLGSARLVVDVVHGSERLSPFYDTLLTRPIHSSATGKVFLWSLPPKNWPLVLGPEPYPALAPNTRRTARELEAEMQGARQQGYAQTCDESVIGMSGVAAPIIGSAGTIIGCFGAFGLTRAKARADRLRQAGERTKLAAGLFSQISPSVQAVSRLFRIAFGAGRDDAHG